MQLNMGALEAGKKYAAEHLDEARSVPRRAHEQDGRPDAGRGQRRRRDGLHVRRRHRRRLVSDHAVVVAARDAHRLHAEVPHGQGDRQGDVRDRAGRGRDRRARHGRRRELGGRAGDDVHVGSRHLADVRVRGPVVLRRDSGRRVRHSARRAVDGPADAHGAGRPAVRRRQLARRHAARDAAAGVGRGVLRDGDGRVRPVRAPPDDRLRDERPRPRHEHLDVASRSRIRRSRSIAARCSTRPRSASWARPGAATRTWTATASRGARCRAPAAPAFFTRGSGHNEMAQYTERPDDYVRNIDRLARKFDTARTLVPRADRRDATPAPRSASSRSARATGRSRSRATSCARRPGCRRRISGCARIRSRRRWTTSSGSTIASTSSSRTATRRC